MAEYVPPFKPGDLVGLKNYPLLEKSIVVEIIDSFAPICKVEYSDGTFAKYWVSDLNLVEFPKPPTPSPEEVAPSLTKQELEVCFKLLSLCAGDNLSYSAYEKLAALFDPDGIAEEPKDVKVYRYNRDGVAKKCKDVFIQFESKK